MKDSPTGSEAAQFLELLQPIEGELEAYCRRLIWDPQEVRDALHNALARAIAAFDRYHQGTNFRAWMFKILTREAFALNRKHHRLAEREFQMEPEEIEALAGPLVEEGPPATGADSVEALQEQLDQHLVLALKTLTDEERATLLLRALGGFKYLEIAETLGMPLGSVIGYLGRARKKVRLALGRPQSQPSVKGKL
jgi:RNA polymerase sigma-70 factor (ECF subfamily)